MRTFVCQCGNQLFFENSVCLRCHRAVGFLPDELRLVGLDLDGQEWTTAGSERRWRKCAHYVRHEVCNWMVRAEDADPHCESCRLNAVIPDLDRPNNLLYWYRLERAKRRLLYSIMSLGLPVVGRSADPERGLAFQFLEDAVLPDGTTHGGARVLTGHANGMITINVSEADPAAGERVRELMKERYRTLLGHFRHEIGHYFWDRLIAPDARTLTEFRVLFGDERADYGAALDTYYREGPRADWRDSYVSAYSTAHPWEDWAETWAHYLHIVDALETAEDYRLTVGGRNMRAAIDRKVETGHGAWYSPEVSFEEILEDWGVLTLGLNALSRSMGHIDSYPFVITAGAAVKLSFIHRLVHRTR